MMTTEKLYECFLKTDGICTDTRKEVEGRMFFALKGDNFNGNMYAGKALELGAAYVVVDEAIDGNTERVLSVEDTLRSLQELASHHRQMLGTKIISITGSNGKTTNKELLALVLSQKYKCYATRGNLNNHIGVPLSLLELNTDHEMAIIEMGANKMGDIHELCEIADPDMGYITNIGLAHLEGFGSQENIAQEKGELFRHVMHKRGRIFVNSSEQEVTEIASGYEEAVFIGEKESDVFFCECLTVSPVINLQVDNNLITSRLYGKHNYENLKMCAAIGLFLGVKPESVRKALESYSPSNNRSQVEVVRGIILYMDAYNANPTSMKASIESFANLAYERKHLILGDMLELGGEAEGLHRNLLDLVRNLEWESVFIIGQCFLKVSKGFPEMIAFPSTADADAAISRAVKQGDAVLLKGSRGLKLESLSLVKP